jgi:hypothetical protein
LEKVACGAFSDTRSVTPAKGKTFAGCPAAAEPSFMLEDG